MQSRIVCKHAELSVVNQVEKTKCGLGLFGGAPKLADCMSCDSYDGRVRGLGDMVAKATSAFGVKPCGKCKERQRKLNKAVPCRGCNKQLTDSANGEKHETDDPDLSGTA
jgi:hypothetical protein